MARSRHPSRAYLLVVHHEAARELQRVRGVGPAAAENLLLAGVRDVKALARADPQRLYEVLCRLDGAKHSAAFRQRLCDAVAEARALRPRRVRRTEEAGRPL